ncbi:MAG TPA: oligosaccharide flippase family protein [Anaerolineales bacterium]|nr:oligosaccharide flippase family protein [Anaerolineales bacterium]
MRKSPPINLARRFPRFLENELIQRVFRNSGYLFSATGLSAGLSMLQSILTARLLGVTDFGILGTITVFTSVVNKFASFRMSELVIKYVGEFSVSGDSRRAAAVFKTAGVTETLTSIFAFGLIWLLAPLGARYFAKDAGLAGWFILYGLIVLANFMSESSTGLLQIFDRYRAIAIVTVGQSLLTLILVGVAYYIQGGLLEVLLAYMAGKTVGSLSLTLIALSEAGQRWGPGWWRSPFGLLRERLGEVGRFAVSTNISATINLVNKDGELLWVSALSSPTGAGYYKLALSLVNLVQLPVSPLPQATYPELSREAARRDWASLRKVLRQGSLLAFAYSLAASLGLLIFGPLIIRIFYTPEFLPAYPAILLLMVGYVVAATFYWNRIALLSLGLPDYPTKVNLIAAGLKVAGILLIVPVFGYLGSAALLSAFYLFSVSLNVRKSYAVLLERQADLA